MKHAYLSVLIMLAVSQSALAAEATGKSPYDNHPACLDRTTDSSGGDCIVKDAGTPRHTYPPKPAPSAAGSTPAAPAAPASAVARTPARASGGGTTGGK